jgi:hypothetical protein
MAHSPDPPPPSHARLQALLEHLEEVTSPSSQADLSASTSGGGVGQVLQGLKEKLVAVAEQVRTLLEF